MQNNVFVGFDTRFPLAYAVTVHSLLYNTRKPLDVQPLLLPDLIAKNIYTRKTSRHNGQAFDNISEFPMATEFAISRFFIPYLCGYKGWSIFCDSDFMFMDDIAEVFAMADPQYAVMCVKHDYAPPEKTKMDGCAQLLYNRKNWSSFMLFNNEHPKNRALSPFFLNRYPGRDYHAFTWLDDSEIGGLPVRWNWLEGHSDPEIKPSAVHFTRGTPDIPGYENVPYSTQWQNYAKKINYYGTFNDASR